MPEQGHEKESHYHDYRSCPLCGEMERLATELRSDIWPAIEKNRDHIQDVKVNLNGLTEKLQSIYDTMTRIENMMTTQLTLNEQNIDRKISSVMQTYEERVSFLKKTLWVTVTAAITAFATGTGWLIQFILSRGN